MVIQNYDVRTTSQHSLLSLKSTSMLATRNINAPASEGKVLSSTTSKAAETAQEDKVALTGENEKKEKSANGLALGHLKQKYKQIQDESYKQLSEMAHRSLQRPHRAAGSRLYGGRQPSNPEELKNRLMEILFELITGSGKSSYSKSVTGENGSYTAIEQSESFAFSMSFFGGFFGIDGAAGANAAARAGWNVEHFEYESEQVSYTAQGVINTADGRTINVDISMHLSRQFTSYMNIGVEAQQRLYDPLVINYNGTAASLSGETFAFDLTSDGNMEHLASLGEGSGFLAIDKNGDGIINDGSELFGPGSGCGFSELREYDYDRNGWIDEADDIFDKLVVWSKDKDGNETSYTLRELGIGAIYLGDIATEFTFKDENNGTLGVMRSTSFFLSENGGAGTVSHIDLAV